MPQPRDNGTEGLQRPRSPPGTLYEHLRGSGVGSSSSATTRTSSLQARVALIGSDPAPTCCSFNLKYWQLHRSKREPFSGLRCFGSLILAGSFFDLGVATLERRSRRGIGGAGPVRCGIPNSDQNLLTDRWLGLGRVLQPFVRSTACRSVPCDL